MKILVVVIAVILSGCSTIGPGGEILHGPGHFVIDVKNGQVRVESRTLRGGPILRISDGPEGRSIEILHNDRMAELGLINDILAR